MHELLREAGNSHDLSRFTALFAVDYDSTQPAHPGRTFVGRAQVLANWTSMFEGVPDYSSELLGCVSDGDREWGEWLWQGHYADGSPFAMRGVTIFDVRDGEIVAGRLYMEPVEEAGGDIEAAVDQLSRRR